jgi:hypothetical protein
MKLTSFKKSSISQLTREASLLQSLDFKFYTSVWDLTINVIITFLIIELAWFIFMTDLSSKEN